jgi:predicted dehydrogenase
VSRKQSELASDFAAEFDAEKSCADWQELLSDPAVQAVYIATPVHLHEPITVAAAKSGRHVLCEKPMALNLDECDRMIGAASAAGVHLGIAYYRRFYPVLERIEEILESRLIGDPVQVRMDAFEFYNPPPSDPRHWFLEKQYAGGGPMFDFGCHRIEVLVRLFGTPDEVRGGTWNVRLDREVEDTAVAILHFPKGPLALLSVTHAAFESRDTLEILGTEGSIHVPVLNKGQLRLVTRAGEVWEDHPPDPNLHLPLIDDFTRAVLSGRSPAVDGTVGKLVNEVLDQIYAGS